MSGLTLALLGTPRLARDRVPLHLHSRKCMALLAYLALTGTSHSRDSLATLLWPRFAAPRARGALRSTLSHLGSALARTWLVVDGEMVALDQSEREAVDALRFRYLLAQCRKHGHGGRQTCPQCLPLLAEAVGLYQGDFMAGFTLRDSPEFDDWQSLETQALRRELAGTLERLAEGYATQGDVERGIGYAQRWLALDPLDETAHRCLMRLYAGSGQQAAALRQYEAVERVLQEELGVPPSAQTADLCQAKGHPERAVELLALVIQHPATRQVDRDRAQHLLSRVACELPPGTLAEATARGQAQDPEAGAIPGRNKDAHRVSGEDRPVSTATGGDSMASTTPSEAAM